MQRLTHAHEHEVSQALTVLAQNAAGVMHLSNDLTRAQVADKTHLAGGAKDAAHGAACLGADAGGVTAGVAHDDGLDFLAVMQLEEVFARESIAAGRLGGDRQNVGLAIAA